METNDFELRVKHHLIARRLLDDTDASMPLLVALSGGADSVALLRVLLALGYRCVAAHCNFHLRGEESMRDQRFVEALCQRLNVPLHVKDFDVTGYCSAHAGTSVEMACRELRYAWFEELRTSLPCGCVVVAHHSDDNVETFFLNLMRGTGLRGLMGMRAVNSTTSVVRPLLCVNREQVLQYLAHLGQDYVTDSTNALDDYTRNRIRHKVLPALNAAFPAASERIIETMSHLADAQLMMDELVDELRAQYEIPTADPGVRQFRHPVKWQCAPQLLHAWVGDLGFNHDQCAQAIESINNQRWGTHFFARDYIMSIDRERIVCFPADADIHPVSINLNDLCQQESWPFIVELVDGQLIAGEVDGRQRIALSLDVLHCKEVVVRRWHEGDRMTPYGMRGSKLVSDLFADAKWNEWQKKNARLLVADGHVLWVMGLRASSHFAVANTDTRYLLIKIKE